MIDFVMCFYIKVFIAVNNMEDQLLANVDADCISLTENICADLLRSDVNLSLIEEKALKIQAIYDDGEPLKEISAKDSALYFKEAENTKISTEDDVISRKIEDIHHMINANERQNIRDLSYVVKNGIDMSVPDKIIEEKEVECRSKSYIKQSSSKMNLPIMWEVITPVIDISLIESKKNNKEDINPSVYSIIKHNMSESIPPTSFKILDSRNSTPSTSSRNSKIKIIKRDSSKKCLKICIDIMQMNSDIRKKFKSQNTNSKTVVQQNLIFLTGLDDKIKTNIKNRISIENTKTKLDKNLEDRRILIKDGYCDDFNNHITAENQFKTCVFDKIESFVMCRFTILSTLFNSNEGSEIYLNMSKSTDPLKFRLKDQYKIMCVFYPEFMIIMLKFIEGFYPENKIHAAPDNFNLQQKITESFASFIVSYHSMICIINEKMNAEKMHSDIQLLLKLKNEFKREDCIKVYDFLIQISTIIFDKGFDYFIKNIYGKYTNNKKTVFNIKNHILPFLYFTIAYDSNPKNAIKSNDHSFQREFTTFLDPKKCCDISSKNFDTFCMSFVKHITKLHIFSNDDNPFNMETRFKNTIKRKFRRYHIFSHTGYEDIQVTSLQFLKFIIDFLASKF